MYVFTLRIFYTENIFTDGRASLFFLNHHSSKVASHNHHIFQFKNEAFREGMKDMAMASLLLVYCRQGFQFSPVYQVSALGNSAADSRPSIKENKNKISRTFLFFHEKQRKEKKNHESTVCMARRTSDELNCPATLLKPPALMLPKAVGDRSIHHPPPAGSRAGPDSRPLFSRGISLAPSTAAISRLTTNALLPS